MRRARDLRPASHRNPGIQWSGNCFYAIDLLFSAITGGSARETFSSRAARARSRGRWWGRGLCWTLDRLDENHCERARYPSLQGHEAWARTWPTITMTVLVAAGVAVLIARCVG